MKHRQRKTDWEIDGHGLFTVKYCTCHTIPCYTCVLSKKLFFPFKKIYRPGYELLNELLPGTAGTRGTDFIFPCLLVERVRPQNGRNTALVAFASPFDPPSVLMC